MSRQEGEIDDEMVRVLDESFRGNGTIADKDGNKVSKEVAEVMKDLKAKSACHKVLCHWGYTERVGYWSKNKSLNDVVFAVVKQGGFRVSNVSTRVVEMGYERESEVMYAEFVPVEPDEEEGR